MRVCAFDPGSKSCGWAVLERVVHGAHFIAKGTCDASADGVRAVLDLWTPTKVAVERVVAYGALERGHAARMRHLSRTSEIAGMILGLANARELGTRAMTCGEWRRAIGVKGDKGVERALDVLIRGWPSRSNVHERDAAGLAFVVLNGARA